MDKVARTAVDILVLAANLEHQQLVDMKLPVARRVPLASDTQAEDMD